MSIPTRLGVDYGDSAVFLGRVGAPRAPDLFDFYLSASDAAAFTFQADYGPVIGTGVFALNQFQNVTTSEGPLTISSSGDVLFYTTGASLIPEPSTWAMMLLGFAGPRLCRLSDLTQGRLDRGLIGILTHHVGRANSDPSPDGALKIVASGAGRRRGGVGRFSQLPKFA